MEPEKKKRGFAAMNPERAREIQSAGGKAAHVKGTAHEYTAEEASSAGKKGAIANALKRQQAAS